MPGDADAIRCASPWPGLAAQLLDAFASLGTGKWTVETLCEASGVGILPGDANQVLAGLEVAGLCSRSEDGETWSSHLNHGEIQRLSSMLRGAEHYRRLKQGAPNLEFAVTMPMSPSLLEEQLPPALGRPGGYLPTATAFLRIAGAAKTRLVVMMPFIDRRGFDWLRTVLEASDRDVTKIIVLRDAEQYAIDLGMHHADWLRALDVSVRDYTLSHDSGGRALPLETFHAKIVLADDCCAYVGSANMLGSGDGTSLEAGLFIDGQAVRPIARLVDGVLRIARRL